MEKLFVPYQPSLDMKELGFDEPCLAFFWNTGKFYTCADYVHTISYHLQNQLGHYNYDSISAPTWQQAFRWFREKHKLHQIVLADEKGKYDIIVGKRISGSCLGQYETYEEAELECLKKLIEIRQSQKTSDESPDTRTFRTPSSDYNSRGQYRK